MKVLYCGMANDVMAPLLLIPNVDTIFVISLFDACFCSKGTWKSQKSDIRQILIDGSDKNNLPKRKLYDEEDTGEIHYLASKSEILEERDNNSKKRWYLKFKYNGKIRKLIYYYERDCRLSWPNEMYDISDVMFMGSLSADDFGKRRFVIFRRMLKKRCTHTFKLYGLWFDHQYYGFDDMITIKDGHERDGTEIGILQLTTNEIGRKY